MEEAADPLLIDGPGDFIEASFEPTDSPADIAEEGRPRRRRRRRRGRGRKGAREGEGRAESASPGQLADERELPADSDEEEPLDYQRRDRNQLDDGDDGDDGHELDKSHRTVPSWEEAIGLIVSVNMEARIKSPNSRPTHRGRGRGRGGRGRRDGGNR